ncbi:MAG: DUF1553 domain-containing protein, partial [Lentisphaeraceae bacterium]|nr:DUF1553 domain-containing protein [Lentisphaeraceae bacterium]
LAQSTDQQKVATGFLRNSMNTPEGGILPEEYRSLYNIDKVDTVSTAFLGLTVKCAQCHDHKFDPISQKDFYSMYAFFNTSSEGGMGSKKGNSKPYVEVNSLLTPKAEMIKAYQQRIVELENKKKFVRQQKSYLDFPVKFGIKTIDKEISTLKKQIKRGKTSVMVMDYKKRKTHVFIRGQYTNLGEEVEPGALQQIFPFDEKYPKNRLGLAQWMLAHDNPLTARVAVNRYWQLIFGTGLVKTAEDFGSQGEFPSHRKLLDYLAVEFRDNKWNIRDLIKKMVMSATYQQSSKEKAQFAEKDPYNRLHYRAPVFRLAAEFVRDNALAAAGLLNRHIGGPSVYSAQPGGLWSQVSHFGNKAAFTAQTFIESEASALYRRSMYTVVKRTAGHPAMAAFDAPSRETCTTRRQQTNTPLQSLVMMNDPQFLNAARALALRMTAHTGDLQGRLKNGFLLVTGRQPQARELAVLTNAYEEQLRHYQSRPEDTKSLLTREGSASDAAMVMTASTLLNLSESITRN